MRRLLVLLTLSAVLGAAATAPAQTGPEPGRLVATFRFDTSRGVPTEGTLSYIELRRKGSDAITTTELRGPYDARRLSTPLTPGRYRLRSYQRSCRGTCEDLDPPSFLCARDVRIRSGATLRARIAVDFADGPGGRCRIELRR